MAVELADFLDRPYRIPNQDESTDLENFITAKEEELLRDLLGTTLYDAYIAGISAGSPAQKWVDLRDGKNYTYGGVTFHFAGLDACLIPAIFALWVKETSDQFTASGTVRNAPVLNGTAVSPARRISEAWGRWLTLVGSECQYWDSLYGFLVANATDYDFDGTDWVTPGSMNAFDL